MLLCIRHHKMFLLPFSKIHTPFHLKETNKWKQLIADEHKMLSEVNGLLRKRKNERTSYGTLGIIIPPSPFSSSSGKSSISSSPCFANIFTLLSLTDAPNSKPLSASFLLLFVAEVPVCYNERTMLVYAKEHHNCIQLRK